MRPGPLRPPDPTPELLRVARRVIWYQSPEATLRDPVLLLNQAMTTGQIEDLRVLRAHFTDDDLRCAVREARPGVFDARSWSYWHLMLDLGPAPPLPVRCIPGVDRPTPPDAWRRPRRADAEPEG